LQTSDFERPEGERIQPEGPAMMVDVAGFEGPLDLLLALARNQQVDLAKISILALADQYLQFIETARGLKIEIAADYLVMAAWLAYLKSRLLLPEPPADEEQPSAADLAADLQARLQHLEAIRQAGARLITRHRLGMDFFERGMPETIEAAPGKFKATLYDLLSAYAMQRQRQGLQTVKLPLRTVWSLKEAREVLERMIGKATDWTRLDQYLIKYLVEPDMRVTVFASSFTASLEMVREGMIEIQQKAAFEPLWLRRRATARLVQDGETKN